jgi:outer membrane protein
MSLISTRVSTWSFSSVLCALLFFGSISFGFAQDLAYVDLQRAVAEVNEGKAALNQLKGMMESRQKSFEKKKKAVEKLQENFQKQAQFMTDEVKQKKKVKSFKRRWRSFNKYTQP